MEGEPKNINELEKQTLIDEVVLNLKDGFVDKAYKILKEKPYAEDILKLPIVQELATEEMVKRMQNYQQNN